MIAQIVNGRSILTKKGAFPRIEKKRGGGAPYCKITP